MRRKRKRKRKRERREGRSVCESESESLKERFEREVADGFGERLWFVFVRLSKRSLTLVNYVLTF